MDTNVRTPQEVFFLPQHLVVPLFQRPYVWEKEEQWEPLWQDVKRMAEMRLTDPHSTARHFLGAVVLQASDPVVGTVQSWNLIDGQQRLTTLQLLADATAAVLEEAGLDQLTQQLGSLTHNPGYFGADGPALKVRHTNEDGPAFVEVMSAEPPVDHERLTHAGARIVRAHAFFTTEVAGWLREGGDEVARRAGALTDVITQGLQLVVINLQAHENSQEIFETLNGRGTPLTAADLIKNLVFQRLEAEGVDIGKAYAEDWPFKSKFWDTAVSAGRYSMSRGSLFLQQWLIARLGEEIGPLRTFVRFKQYVDFEADVKMSELLKAIKASAEQYERWTVASEDTSRVLDRPQMAFYRMRATGVELLKPVMIWLYDPESGVPGAAADEIVTMLESWVVRRQLLRLSGSSLGRVVADLIRAHRTVAPPELSSRVAAFLTRLNVATTYWPGDDEVRRALLTEKAYRRYPRARLRMFLEAIEDQLRSEHHGQQVARVGYPIEHILPQKWEQHWGVSGLEAQMARGEHVHLLGNLTLLTSSLNSTVSNSDWRRKRTHLDKHDVFLLNRGFKDIEDWDEAQIDARTQRMIDSLLAIWPVPQGHTGEVSDAGTRSENSWVEIKHLVASGLLPVGTVLHPRDSRWTARAVVTESGSLDVGGRIFGSPSPAAGHVRNGSTNGWTFWQLEDGRALAELRAEYRGEKPDSGTVQRFDWSGLHTILEALPAGQWTSYSELADAVGTAPQPLGTHMTRCRQCAHAWRVLTADGTVASQFGWPDPAGERDPRVLLEEEGLRFIAGRADPTAFMTSEALSELG